jgi:hypothetical protein
MYRDLLRILSACNETYYFSIIETIKDSLLMLGGQAEIIIYKTPNMNRGFV